MQRQFLPAGHEWERTFDSVPDLISILDRDHRIMRANRAMAGRLGLTPEQCVGQLCYKIVHGLDAPPDFCPHSKVLADGQEHTTEVHEPRVNGDFFVSVTPLRDEDGQVVGSVHVARDITERKRTEESLRKSEERLRLAQSYGGVGVWGWEVATGQLTLEPEAERLYGLAPGSMRTYADWARRVHPDDLPSIESERQAALAAHMPFEVEFRILHPSGAERWLAARGSGVYDEASQLVRVLGINIDVTDRKLAEEALRRSEERRKVAEAVQAERQRLNDVLDLLPAYVVLLTPDHHVPFANRFFRERFGEAHGKRCFEYLFGRTEPCEVCESYKVLETGMPQHWEWTGPDGRHYDIFDYPFKDTDGSPLVMEVGIDITERKLAEQGLKDANDTLEQRVERRTQELAKAKLAAEAANAAKDRFIAVLSHELRTPLTPTLMLAHLHKDDPNLSEELRQDLSTIHQNIVVEARLIDDLIGITHVGTGKLLLRQDRVDAGEIIREAVRACGNERQVKAQSLTMEMPDAPYPVFADAARLRKAFLNVLTNAAKFTPEGGKIAVRCARFEDDAGAWVRVTVSDTGMGIEPDFFPRLFRPFEQGYRVLVDAFGGFGLGLSVAKAVVEMHGGRINASSDGAGKGATFSIELPLTDLA